MSGEGSNTVETDRDEGDERELEEEAELYGKLKRQIHEFEEYLELKGSNLEIRTQSGHRKDVDFKKKEDLLLLSSLIQPKNFSKLRNDSFYRKLSQTSFRKSSRTSKELRNRARQLVRKINKVYLWNLLNNSEDMIVITDSPRYESFCKISASLRHYVLGLHEKSWKPNPFKEEDYEENDDSDDSVILIDCD